MKPAVAISPVTDTAFTAAARAPWSSCRQPCPIPSTTTAGPTGSDVATEDTVVVEVGEVDRGDEEHAVTRNVSAAVAAIQRGGDCPIAQVALNTVRAIECESPANIAAPIPPSTHFLPAADAE